VAPEGIPLEELVKESEKLLVGLPGGAGQVVELPVGFSGQDAGEAAEQVLQALRAEGSSS